MAVCVKVDVYIALCVQSRLAFLWAQFCHCLLSLVNESSLNSRSWLASGWWLLVVGSIHFLVTVWKLLIVKYMLLLSVDSAYIFSGLKLLNI